AKKRLRARPVIAWRRKKRRKKSNFEQLSPRHAPSRGGQSERAAGTRTRDAKNIDDV
ncbi:hypothetical protein JYU34_018153, partial [Plutella xylostella]